MDCIFCKIIEKEIPSSMVYEDDFVYAFKDIHPVAPVHIIIVPKIHMTNINYIDETNSKYIAKVFESIPKIAKETRVFDTGYRVITNTGVDGGQSVLHLHFHLIGGKHLGEKIIH